MASPTARDAFFALHQGSEPLLLANAWDAGSAALIESLGAKAIATTSAGVCWARGHADGDALPIDELVDAIRGIARVVRVPLSADIEGGYSSEPTAVAGLAARLGDAGVVGINLEDGTHPPALLCRKIEVIRKSTGNGLFINARIDVVLRGMASGDAAVDEVCRRAGSYREAGCDGIFVPGLVDLQAMAAIAKAIAPLPLNVMLVPGLPKAAVLHQHGVRRLSAGSSLAQAALGHAARLATEFLAGNGEAVFAQRGAEYRSMNGLLARRSPLDH